ncbi:hypothetical protein L7F22_065545 [Adiantum nelumboides]|nr:hypothetical protein [Adiantum nelumboides]
MIVNPMQSVEEEHDDLEESSPHDSDCHGRILAVTVTKKLSHVPDAILSREAQKGYQFADTELIVMKGIVAGRPVRVLFDTGSTHNVINSNLVKKIKLQTTPSEYCYSVELADGMGTETWDRRVVDLPVEIQSYKDRLDFELTRLARFDLVLSKQEERMSDFIQASGQVAQEGHSSTNATWLSFINTCKQPVWPASQSNAGKPVLGNGADGFELAPGERRALELPAAWAGRIWGRTGCNFSKPTDGTPKCLTGDCGGGSLQCGGAGGVPPVTIFELTLAGFGGQDFYDVSLVDGYNLPMVALPAHGTSGSCLPTGCLRDVNSVCPTVLQVRNGATTIACKSACAALGSPEFCCTGAFATPQTCQPTDYSRLFKARCPRAYSYAFDDASSTFTCTNPKGYYITFCPK